MDQIRIDNLQIFAYHGVYPEENEKGQNFYVNAVLYTDLKAAGERDDLTLSTNYGEVCRFLQQYLTTHTYKLIESVAQQAAKNLLLRFPLIKQVTLEIRKPEAPIPLTFESVSVKIHRGWKKACLSCGSNIGNKMQYLQNAITALEEDSMCHVLAVSDFMKTTPYGGVAQDDFLNGAIVIETLYDPEELLLKLHQIEQENGRERLIHWGPRTLDLDILLYEDCIINTENLTIPHIDMHNRDFVLAPLKQIAPYALHPVLHKTIGQLYDEVIGKGKNLTIS